MKNKLDVALAFVVGIGAGFGMGCMLAPQSGDDTRSLLTKRAKRAARSVKQQAGDLLDSAGDVLDEGRSRLAQQQAGVYNAVTAGKKAYQQTVS